MAGTLDGQKTVTLVVVAKDKAGKTETSRTENMAPRLAQALATTIRKSGLPGLVEVRVE